VAEVFAGRAAAAQAALIDGNPGAVWAPEGRARAAFVMRWSEGRIVEIEVVADPRRLIGEWLDGAAKPLARVLDRLSPSGQEAFLKAMDLLETELHSQDARS
jgi:hypothetical protein